jgi:hypothetical protein
VINEYRNPRRAALGVPGPDRLITVAALTTSGHPEAELIEAITHLAFYARWPKAMAERWSPSASSAAKTQRE